MKASSQRPGRTVHWLLMASLTAFPIMLLGRTTGVLWVEVSTLMWSGFASLVLLGVAKFVGDTRLKPVHIVVAGLVVLLGSCWTSPFRPPDRVVARQFTRSSEQFERLVTMLREDPRVGTVGPGFITAAGNLVSANPSELGISEARIADYRRIMRDAGVQRTDRLEDGSVQFLTWGWGAIDTFRHKGLVWRRTTPPEGEGRKYTRIREDWYIFED